MPSAPRYWAFISYSHRDKRWGDWLHKAIETYRMPRRLVGGAGREGSVPRRLFPVFRDREELPSSSDLATNIADGLAASRTLVVICSPYAAVSRWVNEEIVAFKRSGGESRILALIVDGEPNASDHPESGELECFPPSLRHRLGQDGALTAEPTEPIAADARPGRDGRANALLKIIAGIAGVPYDALKQRERRRRRIRLATAGVAAAALLAAGGFAWRQYRVDRETDAFAAAGRAALLQHDTDRAAVWLSAAYARRPHDPTLRFMMRQSMSTIDMRRTFVATGCARTGGASYSADGSRLAFTCDDVDIAVLGAGDGAAIARIHAEADRYQTARLDRAGVRVIVPERTTMVGVYDVASGRRLRSFDLGSDMVIARFVHQDEWILAAAPDVARLWRLSDGALLHEFHGDVRSVPLQVAEPRASPWELAVSNDDTLCLHDDADTRLVRAVDGGVIRRFSAPGRCLFADQGHRGIWVHRQANEGNAIETFDSASGRTLTRVELGTDAVNDVRFSRGAGSTFLAIAPVGTSVLRDALTGAIRGRLPPQEPFGGAVEFTASNHALVATVQMGERWRIWPADQILEAASEFSLAGHPYVNPVRDELALLEGAWLIFMDSNGPLQPIASGDDASLRLFATSPNVHSAVFKRPDALRWVREPDGALIAAFPAPGFNDLEVALSVDGRALALRRAEGWAIWREQSPASPVRLESPIDDADGEYHQFVDDDRAFAAAGRDGTLQVWDAATGRLRGTVRPANQAQKFADLSDDGRQYALRETHDTVDSTGRVTHRDEWIDIYDVATAARVSHVASAKVPASFRSSRVAYSSGRITFDDGVALLQAINPADGRPLAARRGFFELFLHDDSGTAVSLAQQEALFWDLSLETRTPADIGHRVLCAVSQHVEGGKLVAVTRPTDCATGSRPAVR